MNMVMVICDIDDWLLFLYTIKLYVIDGDIAKILSVALLSKYIYYSHHISL
jgi:hypothetical protein